VRSANYLAGPAMEHIRWYPAIGDQPPPGSRADEPGPRPWSAAVSGLAEAANVKRIAASLPESDLRNQLEAGAARSIEDILDEWCGPCRPRPGLALGLQTRAIALAAEIAAIANSHQVGFLRDELLRIAGQALVRPVGRRLS
jgi:hypothetical protein